MKLDQINARSIDAYKASVVERLHPKTINNTLTVLRRTLDMAACWGIIETVPRVEWMRAPKPDFRFLDFDEAARLVEAAKPEPEWCTMIVVALNTGLRLGELLGPPWTAVDLKAGCLRVHQALSCGEIGTPKNGRPRDVSRASPETITMPFEASVQASLAERRRQSQPCTGGRPAGDPRGGGALGSRVDVERGLRRARGRARPVCVRARRAYVRPIRTMFKRLVYDFSTSRRFV